jgi:hypothetical protein
VLPLPQASNCGENFPCDKIKHQANRVIPRTLPYLTFVKMRNASLVAASDTFLTAIDFIERIDIKRKYRKAAFRINLRAGRVSSRLSQVL